MSSEIIEVERTVKRDKRGRPKKGEVPVTEKRYVINFEITEDELAFEKEKGKCGMFVLITTLRDTMTYPDREIIFQYKGQQAVENIFRFIKYPVFVGAYCLKNPERIVAFGYFLLMAAQVYTLRFRVLRGTKI